MSIRCPCGRYTTLDILCVFCLNGVPDFGVNENTGLEETESGTIDPEIEEKLGED